MRRILLASTFALLFSQTAYAHDIKSAVDKDKTPAFDITSASVSTDGQLTTFMMEVAGISGSVKPASIGQLTGSKVESYVWPTNMDPSAVGFDKGSGILALAITAHPDFDDTPLFDEDQDGDPNNDGKDWHSHWVVLVEEAACGGGLKVRDVAPGVDLLPGTAPGLPIALDSPGMSPLLNKREAKITMPLKNAEGAQFDAVTAELQINVNGEVPLLCVSSVHDIASGDLSLPGKIMSAK